MDCYKTSQLFCFIDKCLQNCGVSANSPQACLLTRLQLTWLLRVKLLKTCPLDWVDGFPLNSPEVTPPPHSNYKDRRSKCSLCPALSFYRLNMINTLTTCWHLWNILFSLSIEWQLLTYPPKPSFRQICWQLRSLIVHLLVDNMFVERLGFRRVMMMAFDAKVNIDFLFVDRLASCVVV